MHRKTVIDFRAFGGDTPSLSLSKELKTRDLSEVADLLAQVESYQEKVIMSWAMSAGAAPAFEEKLAVHKLPLLGRGYLLYFTVHDRVETSLFL